VITIEKVDLGDFIRLAILSCIEITYDWPVAIMEFDFPTCAVGVKDSCCGGVRHSKHWGSDLLKHRLVLVLTKFSGLHLFLSFTFFCKSVTFSGLGWQGTGVALSFGLSWFSLI
jgi:hypothetical protein